MCDRSEPDVDEEQSPDRSARQHGWLEAVDLDGIALKAEAVVLVGEELLDLVALVALQLDHLAHALGLRVGDDCAIASELLLDDLQNLLVVELRRNALDCGQGLTSIALLNANMDVFACLFGLSGILVGLGEGVIGLEIFDGHKLGVPGVVLGKGLVGKHWGGATDDCGVSR